MKNQRSRLFFFWSSCQNFPLNSWSAALRGLTDLEQPQISAAAGLTGLALVSYLHQNASKTSKHRRTRFKRADIKRTRRREKKDVYFQPRLRNRNIKPRQNLGITGSSGLNFPPGRWNEFPGREKRDKMSFKSPTATFLLLLCCSSAEPRPRRGHQRVKKEIMKVRKVEFSSGDLSQSPPPSIS